MLSCFDGLNEMYETTSGLNMVYVPAGTFNRDGMPTNTSYVSAFYMSPYEITRAQFLSVMGQDHSNIAHSPSADCPVQNANWYDALVFCNRMSIREGLTPVYSINGSTNPDSWGAAPTAFSDPVWDAAVCNMNADGYRLPTEMEWRWAAMGATSDRRSGDIVAGINERGYSKGYAGSNEIADYAVVKYASYSWCSDNAAGTAHPVGIKLPNELGIYDMSGNVWEWCWDWYNGIPAISLSNYTGSTTGIQRIWIGGGHFDGVSQANVEVFRNDYRTNVVGNPFDRNDYVGFRVVRSAGISY